MSLLTTEAYDSASAQLQKEPILVLEIDGSPYLFSSGTIYTKIKYDDPGVLYDGTYVYDGLRPLDPESFLSLIDRQGSSSTISQKLEQWDGKASVSTFNIKLVDANKVVTKLCTPGHYIEDIINRKVKVWLGYRSISYPDDYLKIFQGYINNVKIAQGAVFFTFTDPSSKRKQTLFNGSTSKITTAISDTDTSLVLSSTTNLYRTITNAKGVADSSVTIGFVIDGVEIVTYTNAGITSGTNVTVSRGQYGTMAIPHDADVEIIPFIRLHDNPINIALKTHLSGWAGPWAEDIKLRGIVNLDNGLTQNNTITFSQGVDLRRDYGLVQGDFIILSGSFNPSNNGVFTVLDFANSNRTAVVSETTLIQENPPSLGSLSTVAAFRSKYDVYPVEAGLGLEADDVLVDTFEYNRNTFVQFSFDMKVVGSEANAKQWVEQNMFKPIGAYSLTQGSRISMGLTHAPLASDLTKFINPDNVINPSGIEVERGLNTRFFYNEVLFNYAYNVIRNEFDRSYRVIDADAQSRVNQVSVLQIDIKGLNDEANSIVIMAQRAKRILQRYRFSAETVKLETNFAAGHTVDSGDVAILTDTDPPTLQIANTESGGRGIASKIMEVQERTIDISGGKTSMVLLSNNGFSISDRYGVVGPASWLDDTFTHTASVIKIKPSFAMTYGDLEYKKWLPCEGSEIKIHDVNYTVRANASYSLDAFDKNILHLSPALPFTPTAGMVIEFADYDQTDETKNALVKSQFAFRCGTGFVFSGSSTTVFTLQSGYSARYKSGMVIYVMSPDGSRYSPDVKILTVIGDIVTVGPVIDGGTVDNLGFIPQSSDLVQLAGFLDNGAGYRLI
jgi:hypothetical protein